jgi:hypothetical protein
MPFRHARHAGNHESGAGRETKLNSLQSASAKTGASGPLEERKARLAKLLTKAKAGIQYTEHLEGDGAAIFAHACRLGAEGIVSKHCEHPYRSGPSKAQEPRGARRAAVPGGARVMRKRSPEKLDRRKKAPFRDRNGASRQA